MKKYYDLLQNCDWFFCDYAQSISD
jgi:hypothetical protein